jgi:DNA ligase-4
MTLNSIIWNQQIPKSIKGRGCVDALRHFATSHKVWAETKYDGERAQIHVEVREDGGSHITIFSKSKRDSTLDRYGIHGSVSPIARPISY